jgi:hypothetical protein
MRAFIALAALTLATPAIGQPPSTQPPANCKAVTPYLAREQAGAYQGKGVTPKKLGQLPAGTAYMAVYRQIGGCEAPLMLSDYRNPRRR